MRSRPLALAVALTAAACSHGPAPAPGHSAVPAGGAPAGASATPVPIRVETHGGNGRYVNIVESIRGRKVYTIRATSSAFERNGTNQASGVFGEPHITFVERSGAATVADAPQAHVTERDKTVVMTGGVHARTSAGTVLTCDTLTYHGNTERFAGEGHVRLASPGGGGTVTIAGDHLDGDVKLQDVKITRSSR